MKTFLDLILWYWWQNFTFSSNLWHHADFVTEHVSLNCSLSSCTISGGLSDILKFHKKFTSGLWKMYLYSSEKVLKSFIDQYNFPETQLWIFGECRDKKYAFKRLKLIHLLYFIFCQPIRYMLGGHKSGFSHVEHVLKPRLMSVKGKHTPRIREVTGSCIVVAHVRILHAFCCCIKASISSWGFSISRICAYRENTVRKLEKTLKDRLHWVLASTLWWYSDWKQWSHSPILEQLHCFHSEQYHWRHRSVEADAQCKRALSSWQKNTNATTWLWLSIQRHWLSNVCSLWQCVHFVYVTVARLRDLLQFAKSC